MEACWGDAPLVEGPGALLCNVSCMCIDDA